MGQHKKSKSWSALITFPAMLTPSSSSGTRHLCQPITTTDSNNATEKQDNKYTQPAKMPPSAISMKKSSSQQQYSSQSYGIGSGSGSYRKSNDNIDNDEPNFNNNSNSSNNKKSIELDSHDRDELLGSDMVVHSLPLFYLFSSDALADEHAKEDTIVPFMEPPSLALDQATLIAGVLESLVRVVDDIPTGITDDDSSSGNMTNDTEYEDHDTDSDDDSDGDGETNERVGSGMNTFDMEPTVGNGHPKSWMDSKTDDGNDISFGSESSSPENIHLPSSTGSSTRRSPYTMQSYTDQPQPHLSSTTMTTTTTSTTHRAYPNPSTSTLSNFSSSTSAYTLRNNDHHHRQQYCSDLLACPFTIIGLGSFKVVLWPSVMQSFSGNQDLNLVILVSPTYPDHDIIDIMYKMEKSLKHALSSVIDTTINAQLIGQHLTPLVRRSFVVE